jgi:hypothetical protein
MPADLPDSLMGFIDEAEPSERTLLLVNRTEPVPLVELLEEAFADQPVSVAESHRSDRADDVVCLVDDGEVVATTPLAELQEAYLMVNADRYRTGTRQVERGSFPAVLTDLDDIEFLVRGFPKSNREKLLLIVISRFIEARALTAGAGELHSTFQRLSRLDDELGTRRMYEWAAEAGVDTHVYGVDDDPTVVADLDLTVHAGDHAEYRNSWVVLFQPDEGRDGDTSAGTPDGVDLGPVALVAVEVGDNVWRGAWTYEPERVGRIRKYLRENF